MSRGRWPFAENDADARHARLPAAVDIRAGNAAHDAGHRPRQVDEVAAVQRQRLDLLLVDRGAELGRGGLHQRRRAGDGHRLLDTAPTSSRTLKRSR